MYLYFITLHLTVGSQSTRADDWIRCPLAISPPSPPPCKDMRSLFKKDTEESFGERKTGSLNLDDVDILPLSGMSRT